MDEFEVIENGCALHFSAMDRRRTAVHEAGHAVAYSLAGFGLACVQIAPEGVPVAQLQQWGFCVPADVGVYVVGMHWSQDAGSFVIDRRAHLEHVRQLQAHSARRLRRQMRASVCARLAGQLAERHAAERGPRAALEGIAAGSARLSDPAFALVEQEFEIEEALAISALLPSRRAYEHALRATAGALLDHWCFVEQLAGELERVGRLQGKHLAGLLPPAKRDWPPAFVRSPGSVADR